MTEENKAGQSTADASPRTNIAIVCVHGVGFTGEGETVDKFVDTLKSIDFERAGSPKTYQLTPRSGSNAAKFPAFVQEVDSVEFGNIVFAEVYWADLSKNRRTVPHILLGLLSIIFNLRYVVDCASIHPQRTAQKIQRVVLCATSLLLCGPLAAVYICSAFVFLCHFLLQSVDWISQITFLPELYYPDQVSVFQDDLVTKWELVVSTVILLMLSFVLWNASRRNRPSWGGTWRLLTMWLTIVALLLFVYLIYRMFYKNSPVTMPSEPVQMLLYAQYLVAFISILAIFALIQAVYLVATDFANWRSYSIGIGTTLLQFGLWSLIVPGAAFLLFGYPIEEFGDLQRDARDILLTHLALAFVPSIAIVIVWLIRHCGFRWLHWKTGPRLIVHKWVLLLLILISGFGILIHLNEFSRTSLPSQQHLHIDSLIDIRRFIWPERLADFFRPAIRRFIVVFLFVLVGVICFLKIPEVIHLLADVISHFYRPRLRPWGQIDFEPETVIQKTISDRFHCVLEQVRDDYDPQQLLIVSHSQGTVNAIIGLARVYKNLHEDDDRRFQPLFDWLNRLPVNLVTMGSPFTHLYQSYFPGRYDSLYENNKWNEDTWGDWRGGMVDSWTNLSRTDDYVGTFVTGNNEYPENISLDPGGHINYWNRDDVANQIRAVLTKKTHTPTKTP